MTQTPSSKPTPQNAARSSKAAFQNTAGRVVPPPPPPRRTVPVEDTQRPSRLQDAASPSQAAPTRREPESSVDSKPLQRRPWQGWSVRTKATVLAIVIGTTPVLVVGGIGTYIASRIITKQAIQDRQRLAKEISLQMSDFTQKRLHDVDSIAHAPFVVEPATQNRTPANLIVNYFDNFANQDATYELISAITTDGAFARILNGSVPFRNSKAVVRPESEAPGVRAFVQENATYFLEVRDSLRPAVEPLRISSQTGKSAFFIATPAVNPLTNRLSYVIYSRTQASDISQLITNRVQALLQNLGDNSQFNFSVVDNTTHYFQTTAAGKLARIPSTRIQAQGNSILVDGKVFQPGGDISTQRNRIFVSRDNENAGIEMQTIFPKYAELSQAGEATSITDVSKLDGKQYLLTYAPIAQPQNLSFSWGVLTYEPTSVVFAPQRTLILLLVAGTAISAVFVAAIAAAIANRATRPLQTMADAVEKIGQGDLNTRVEVAGKDELGTLGQTLNSMTERLRESLDAQLFEASQERLLTAAKGSSTLRRPDLQGLFDTVLAEARALLKLDRIVVYQFDVGGSGGVVAESVDDRWTSAVENNVDDTCIPTELRQAYLQGRVLATTDVTQADFHADHLRLLKRLEVKASLVVPLLGSGQLFGLLIAHSCMAPHAWSDAEINFLKRLGNELGLSIYRVDLLEQTIALAEEQRQLKEALQRRALELLQEVDPISRGDLTTRAKVTADEIGTIADSYNATVASLRKIVQQVQNAVNQVVETTSVQENSVQMLSAEALRQAEEIADALELVQKMAAVAQDVARNAEQAEKAVQQAAQTVQEGDTVMDRTVEGIQVIRSTVADTAKKVKHLGESSQKISKVVELISAFAAQTNMLALNASIEASRAGEEGRGFAVVANEVRALARQSAEAAEEIRELIASIQGETNEVVIAMESGIEQVVIGTQLVDETRQSLNKITAVSAQISELVEAIAQSTVVQSQASETVTQTMIDMVAVANKTSTEASQVSTSFEELRKVAETLQAGVGQFKL
ncbi:MAG TPA: methyl-accepting chemotaxis protein [Crinalium sp.]